MPHALIIEDDEPIAALVADKLQSLGHTCEAAYTQPEAEDHLKITAYDYILLDLAIPMRFGGKADKQFGRNLLEKIMGPLGHETTPVIIMTANDLDTYSVAVELMKKGAVDFVGKPFDEDDRLEKAIHRALKLRPPRSAGGAADDTQHGPLLPFDGATIDFYDDQVLINGRKIAGERKSTQMRKVLDRLLEKHGSSEKCPLTGARIAKDLDFPNGEKTTNEAVRQIRKCACDKLKKHEHVAAAGNDIVANDDKGYMFGPKIRIHVNGADPSEAGDCRFSPNQLKILRELRQQPSIAPAVLARRLNLLTKALKAELDVLEAGEFIRRTCNGQARRIELINDPRSSVSEPGNTGSRQPKSGSDAQA